MQSALPIRIELTEFEQALLEQINFDDEAGDETVLASGRASRQLMESLYRRNAIPEIRQSYFTFPFPGGRGTSHFEVFRRLLEGTGKHIFEDPYFVRHHLRYFISGPDLPRTAVEGFCSIASKGDIDGLLSFVREEMRKTPRADRHRSANEFYKLAFECFPDDPNTPKKVRETALRVRYRQRGAIVVRGGALGWIC